MNRDLTTGRPGSVLWRFCLPLFGSVLFQQLYQIADSFVAGKFVGETALAAVGNSYEITLIFIAAAFGCNIGCSVVVSQLFGGKRYGEVKTAVSTAMFASGALCAVLMAAGLLAGGGMLRLIRTPAEIFADSHLYLNIYVLGLPFLFFYNISNGIFSALGDSRTPFVFLAVSSTVNIAVDILFVTVFSMGVAGVAWATFLCQGVSCLLAVAAVFHRLKGFYIAKRQPLFSKWLFKRFAAIAVPSILQQSFISVGNIIIQGVINSFGAGVIAGYAAGVKLNSLAITSFTTLGNGISNFAAQNIGGGQPARVRAGFRAGIRLVWLICLPIVPLYFFGGRYLIGLFLENPSADALGTGMLFLRILAPFYLVISVKLAADGVLRGVGLMRQFMVATFTDLTLRVILAIMLSRVFGSVGIWSAWPVGWCVATALSLLLYRSGMKTLQKGGS